jgi:hypothetical protein
MSDLLGGMTISLEPAEEGSQVTTMVGELSDQSALAGVLNTLYELHMPVLSVKRMNTGSPDDGTQDQR